MRADMSQPFLEVNKINKDFGGVHAVNNVSFSMSRDEVLGLIGPNGAGKTTLLRLITGILGETSGEVSFKGKKISGSRNWAVVLITLISHDIASSRPPPIAAPLIAAITGLGYVSILVKTSWGASLKLKASST